MMLNLLNKITLDAIKTALKNHDEMTINCMGLTFHEAQELAKLETSEIEYMIANNINYIQVHVDIKTIQKSLQSFQRKTHYDQLIMEALTYGANREIMYQYAKLSHKQFTQLRKHLNLVTSRTGSLSDEQIVVLEAAINVKEIIQKISINLEYLVATAKTTDIPISSIYAYLLENWNHKYEFK